MLCRTAGGGIFRLKPPGGDLTDGLCFAQTAFDIRKLPKTCQQAVPFALSDGITISAAKKKDGFLFDPSGGRRRPDRIRKLVMHKMGKAYPVQRAAFTAGCGVWKTNGFPDLYLPLHQIRKINEPLPSDSFKME